MYKKDALSLYMTAFPEDSHDFAADFTNRYFDKNCRYILKDGKLVSMLYLLDCSLKTEEKNYPAAYLYAAATLPRYRGQGLMAELIEKAKEETVNNGKFLLTKPATLSLYDYYEQFGFKTCMFKEEYTVSDIPQNGAELSVNDYIILREKFLKGIPHADLTDLFYHIKGLKLVGNKDFCAAIETEDGSVKEFLKTEHISSNKPFAMLMGNSIEDLPEKVYFGFALD